MLQRSLALSVVVSALLGQDGYTISTLNPSRTSPDLPLSDPSGLAISPFFSGDRGPAPSADLAFPSGAAVDTIRNVYVSDTLNNRIRKITKAGLIQTIAGIGTKGFRGDGGPAVQAELASPMGLAVDPLGNIYIADRENNPVRKVSGDGTIQTVTGSGSKRGAATIRMA